MQRDSQAAAEAPSPASSLAIGMVVFLSGAIVMTLELVGSRLLAPYFGNSLFVWTSLIGVMLGFMALGNYIGGRLGDRYHSARALFWIFALASFTVSVVAFSEGFFLPRLAEVPALRLAAVLSAVILFAIPSILLGMVTPYCIRLRMHAVYDSGTTVGSLYALSTIGSIVGTFAAGFWLIATIGSHNIIAWLAAALLALAAFFALPFDWRRAAMMATALALLVGAALYSYSSIDSFDTQYDRYFIGHEIETSTMRPVVTLARDADTIESAAYEDNGEPFLFGYYDFYDLALRLAPKVENTLLIGGGTFSYPRHQLEMYPSSTTDVVEIDPALVDVARESFALEDDPRMRIAVEDGRIFLNKTTEKYDVVLIDAFKSASSIPYQLTTRESMKRVYDVLEDDGILVMNTIASQSGQGSRFVWAEYLTLKTIFPQVELFAVYDPARPNLVQNISIIASKSETRNLLETAERLDPALAAKKLRFTRIPDGTRILTDDFAPVDQYLLGL